VNRERSLAAAGAGRETSGGHARLEAGSGNAGAARADARIAAGLIAAGGALRIVVALRAGIIEHDGAYYAGLAAALAGGDRAHGLSPLWPPLYPALVAAATWLLARAHAPTPETLELAARLVSVAAGIAGLALLRRWVRRIAGARVANVALALAAFHPRLVQFSASALTEMTFTTLVLAALVLLPGPDTPSRRRDLGAGAAFGLAYLTRPEGVLLGAAVGIALALGRGPRLRPAFALGMAALVVPWVLFVHSETGGFSLGEKGAYNFWREYRTEYRAHFAEPAGASERGFESPELARAIPPPRIDVLGLVRAEPWAIAGRTLRRLARIAAQSIPLACYPIYFGFALLGLPLLARRGVRPAAAILVALPVMYAPFTADRRFFVPAVPWLLALAAAGIDRAAEWLAPPPRRAALASGIAAALAVSGAAYSLVHPLMESAPEHRAAGTWLRAAHVAARPIVMSRKPWVAFYAGGLVAELPEGGLDSVLARVRRKRADVLVVDERWGVPTRPELAPLLDPHNAPAGFAVLRRIDSPERLVLYDVRGVR